jgi:integrase
MATIEKRTDAQGSTTYRVKVRIKGAPAQSATFTRKTDAAKWAKSTEAAINEGRYLPKVEARKHTVADLLDRYAADVLPRKKASTQGPQLRHVAWWRSQLGYLTLDALTPVKIAEARDSLAATVSELRKAPLSPATINRHLALLSHACSYAMKELGWIDTNPCTKVAKRQEPRGRVRFLSDAERARLLTACRASSSPDLYPTVVLSLATGARHGELFGLRWPDVDLSRRVAVLHDTKNGERRVLPLTGPALSILTARSKVRRLDTDLIFPARKKQRDGSVKPLDIRTPWETALKVAEIQDFRWHDLRHSAASYLAMNGASLAEIAEVLGHKTLAMVKRYAHLSEAHTAGVVERMTAAIFAAEA